MKMTECFSLPVKCVYDTDGVPFQIDDSYGDLLIDGERTCDETNFEAVAVAINNHDRLVDEVAELRNGLRQLLDGIEDSACHVSGVISLQYEIDTIKQLLNKTENTSND